MIFKELRKKPEYDGARRLRNLMENLGWLTKKSHGNAYQSGWPDLFCSHPQFGQRWIETKAHNGRLSEIQIKEFIEWTKFGVKIWVLRDEKDYGWLFQNPNWWQWAASSQWRPK